MQSFPECIPCITRQVLNTARYITSDDDTQRSVLMEAMKVLQGADYSRAAAEISYHALIRACNLLGCLDPYREAKVHYNNLILDSVDELRGIIDAAEDPLHTAVKMAVAGNIIDMGILGDEFNARETVLHTLEKGLGIDHYAELRNQLDRASNVLYVLDNAGEVVFDRLLIERLTGKDVCCVVRKSPILNDVTRTEAEEVGLTDLCEIIDTGCDVFGVPMELVSDEFRKRFFAADVVISKGQANYETLDEVDRQIFFMLMAKCDRVADNLGVSLRQAVVLDSRTLPQRNDRQLQAHDAKGENT